MPGNMDDQNAPRVLFLGLARNCASTLPLFFRFFETLQRSGFNCTALLGENGSTDASREVIASSGNADIQYVDTSEMSGGPSRLARMAIGRQILSDVSARISPSAEYICVMDMDEVLIKLPSADDLRGAIDSLKSDPKLFAVGATSTPVYYDLLSLKAEGHDYYGLAEALQNEAQFPLTYFQFVSKNIYTNQRAVTRTGVIECESSFNGLCLYNAGDYWKGSYRSANEERVCEHVSLNLSIGEKLSKHMVISPALVLQAPTEHIPAWPVSFWLRRGRKMMRKFCERVSVPGRAS